uniref:TPR_REGION domain-containing protein n=1 Tax=Rhabditophanes sp. KR3021 TaxID=114890 RepID=A0AC35UB88_9BILA
MTEEKKVWTEEERAELADKMDKELEEFIENLAAKKKEREGEVVKKEFNYDEWEKEINQHPAFMTEMPEDGGSQEFNEYIEALRALKYDNGDTPEEIILDAETHKKTGNKLFGLKKYRFASDEYTNGIKLKPVDFDLLSSLYGNRSAANFFLGNYRSCSRDCLWAVKLNPKNYKAITRRTKALMAVNRIQEALDWMEKNWNFVKEDPRNVFPNGWLKEVQEIKKELDAKIKFMERDARKAKKEEKDRIKAAIKYQKYFMENKYTFIEPSIDLKNPEKFNMDSLIVSLPQVATAQKVEVNEDGTCSFPIMLQYPQIGLTDFMTDCVDNKSMADLVSVMDEHWANTDPWTIYSREQIVIAYEAGGENKGLVLVNKDSLLKDILGAKNYFIRGGLPVFQIYVKKHFEEHTVFDARTKIYTLK